MRTETLKEARAEQLLLRSQNMVGYIPFHESVSWNGHIHRRLHRAQDALEGMPAGSEVVLVHASGALYYQVDGRKLGILMTEGHRTHHVQLRRPDRRRILRQHQTTTASQRPMRWNGRRHPGYID